MRPGVELFAQMHDGLHKTAKLIAEKNVLPLEKDVCKQLENLGFSFNYTEPLTTDERRILSETAYVHVIYPKDWELVSPPSVTSMYVEFGIFDSKERLRVIGKCTPISATMELVAPFNLVVKKGMTNSTLAAHIYITGPHGEIVEDFGIKIVSRQHGSLKPFIEEARSHLAKYPTTFED